MIFDLIFCSICCFVLLIGVIIFFLFFKFSSINYSTNKKIENPKVKSENSNIEKQNDIVDAEYREVK